MTASTASSDASNYDEVSMHQNLLFSDNLKDLNNLRSQLYSAAEYFELSYTNEDQKQIVAETLKDYAIKAIVSTVDHLGSVTYKVNDILDEKVNEVSGTEFRVSCIQQRLRTCQEFMDHEGISQQTLVINTPKYHKRYVLPVGETMHGPICTKSKYAGCNLDDEDDWHQFWNAVQSTIRETPMTSVRRGHSRSPSRRAPQSRRAHSPSPSPQPPQRSATFSFTSTMLNKESNKRSMSPHRFPLLYSGPVSSQSTAPNSSRPTSPSAATARRPCPSELRNSGSMHIQAERENLKDIEQYPSKSKRLLKALLNRRKSKKDDSMLYTYLDEY